MLNRLPDAENLDAACDDLKRLVGKNPAVTRPRRFAMLCATAAAPLLLALFTVAIMFAMSQWYRQHPEISELRYYLSYLERSENKQMGQGVDAENRPSPEMEREAMETYIAGKFRSTISDRKVWNGVLGMTIPLPQRKMAERIIAERPAPSEAELADAEATLQPILKKIARSHDATQQMSPVTAGSIQFVIIWIVFVALAGLMTVLVFRRGLIMIVFGVDCTTRSGALASRPRMLWRTLVFNAPVLLAPIVFALMNPLVHASLPLLLAIAGALAVITVFSSLLPTRGLADRLSGTYAVPR